MRFHWAFVIAHRVAPASLYTVRVAPVSVCLPVCQSAACMLSDWPLSLSVCLSVCLPVSLSLFISISLSLAPSTLSDAGECAQRMCACARAGFTQAYHCLHLTQRTFRTSIPSGRMAAGFMNFTPPASASPTVPCRVGGDCLCQQLVKHVRYKACQQLILGVTDSTLHV